MNRIFRTIAFASVFSAAATLAQAQGATDQLTAQTIQALRELNLPTDQVDTLSNGEKSQIISIVYSPGREGGAKRSRVKAILAG